MKTQTQKMKQCSSMRKKNTLKK